MGRRNSTPLIEKGSRENYAHHVKDWKGDHDGKRVRLIKGRVGRKCLYQASCTGEECSATCSGRAFFRIRIGDARERKKRKGGKNFAVFKRAPSEGRKLELRTQGVSILDGGNE